jgi:LuxR family maltose regulon positive regulatory protein
VELDELLLDAKLSIPEPRHGAVSRAELIATARGSECRVVGVTAPAGYGKSTFLAQWALTDDRPVAWVSLDRLDDDPSALITLLASAFARVSPGNSELVADVGGLGTSVLGRAAPRLAAAFRTSPVPFVLMLDDLHELRSPECDDVLDMVIAGLPRGSQLAAASRSEQSRLPRLRASGDALEFHASDLALDASGAEQIFAAAHVTLDPEAAVAVAKRTEGWPVGLYLAALIAQDSQSEASAVAGDDRYVADYLYRESLDRLPEEVQRFLRRTSVLGQFCAPLCDALLGESGAQEMLRTLEASNVFLNPLDRRREWFRYHALFREFLLGELRRVEPHVIMKLQLRAADWYEANGAPAMAVEYLLNTTERDRSVRLVTALVLPTYQSGQIATVQRWLSAFGDSAIAGYPPLAVLAGWITALTGRTAEAQRWAAVIDAASFDLVPADGTASFNSGRAMLRAFMCADGPEQMMADAMLAVAEEPPWSPWRDQALCACAEANLLFGQVEEAGALFADSSLVATSTGNTDVFSLSESERASIAMDRGRWSEAAEHLDAAFAAIDAARMHDYATSALVFSGAARLAVHQGDRVATDTQLTRAMRARPTLTYALPWWAVRLRTQLARVYYSIGDQTTARHLMREVDDILLRRPGLGALVDEVADLRRILTASPQVGVAGSSPLTSAELRLLPYLQTHLTIREIGDRLFVSRNTVSSEVSSIYRKLGVSSRHDAVQRATEVGLLGG